MKKIRILSLVCALVLLFSLLSLAACGKKKGGEDATVVTEGTPTAGTTAEGTTPDVKPAAPVDVKIYTLNGTTGFGMAKLMEDAANGAFITEKYTVEVKTSPAEEVLPALINGSVDIAALPTNAASTVYNRTKGGVKILAVNTLGCLYLVTTDGTAVTSLADLAGKTVYTPAQNPAFLFKHLLQANGLTETVTVDSTSYAEPANLRDAVASGAVAVAVLPEPMVTIAKNAAAKAGKTVAVQLDLTAEWDKIPGEAGTLVQGCVVVRTAFLEAHPEAVANFLAAYKTSVEYVNEHTEEAADLIAKHGIFPQAAVAKTAIPNCNIAYLAGADMKAKMQTYLNILKGIAPASIGGELPADDFYYIGK